MGTANLQGVHMNEAEAPRRIALLDVVRGVALVAMAIFHGAWDVSFLRLVRFDPGESFGWTLFARLIAGTFLAVSGISLVLATRNGIRLKAYFRRLALVAAAAVLVSAATWFVMPQGWVFFGILHQIALAGVLALPFLRAPTPAIAAASAFFLMLPHLFRAEIFATPALWWVGLAPLPPPSFDYVPVFPWFGIVLAGVLAGRLGLQFELDRRLAAWTPRHWPGRLLALGGRHSLLVYLVHQPILFGFFFLIAHVVLPDTAEMAERADCRDSCVAQGLEAGECTAYCGCAFDTIKTEGLMPAYLANSLTPIQMATLRDSFLTCQAKSLRALGDEPPADAPPADGPPSDAPASAAPSR